MSNILHLPITTLAKLIRSGEISPVELIESAFEAIDRGNPELNAFITLFREQSLEGARQAEREIREGHIRGPLHGMPIALKDIIHVTGAPTRCGSSFFSVDSTRPDATVTARLKGAGAIVIGKTNLHEFAYGVTTENPHFGTTANPWNTSHVAGGSSGGSAVAVAAGFSAGALGTDTGGSVRIPAAMCGVVGLKPTYGRISVTGVLELAQSLDCVGPICRRVEDAAVIMNALAGYDISDVNSVNRSVPDYTDSLSDSVSGMKAGLPRQHCFEDLHPDVESSVAEAIEILGQLGVEVVELDLPSIPDAHQATLTLLMAEASHFHRKRLAEHREDYSHDVREIIEDGRKFSASDYVAAVRVREQARREFARAFECVNFLLTPTVPAPAPLRSMMDTSEGSDSNRMRPRLTQNTRIFNLLGLPAISVPCGFTAESLPVGLQIVGRWWAEDELLRVAHTYEQATPWHGMSPNDNGAEADKNSVSTIRG
ncbi:MAG: amidase [Candidatus Poribacteria bacterium]|nr:amidase [Candidatus Poribacteria bacterium]MDE0503246.1 amidase [Candidatus Poribacteria bacterium]